MILWSDYGESSLTLLAVHVGMTKKRPAVPSDPSDFQRCVHLFECLELDKEDIHILLIRASHRHSIWGPFVDAWPELMKLYEEEKDSGKCPKLYARMKELRGG